MNYLATKEIGVLLNVLDSFKEILTLSFPFFSITLFMSYLLMYNSVFLVQRDLNKGINL